MKRENPFQNPRKNQASGRKQTDAKKSTIGKKQEKSRTIDIIDLSQDEKAERQGSMRTTSRISGRKTKSGKKQSRNKEFAIITYLFMAMFLVLIGYFIYFQVFKSEEVISNAYNPRLDLYAEHVIRGDILSSDGQVLATTEVSEDGTQTRVYPYDNMFAHAVGYASNGKAGVESQANFSMLRSHSFFLVQLMNNLRDEKNQGDTVVTTLDYDVQKAAWEALGNNRGAVVVLEPSTGKILAMVSKPDFNPNTVEQNWDSIVEDSNSSALVNRATQGLYPPGSTFKIVTTLEYIRENGLNNNFSFDCEGSIEKDGTTIHCYGNTVHGTEDLASAFANSCNSAYSTIGLSLNLKKYADLCDDLLFNQELPTSLTTKKSSFPLETDAETGKIMQTAIGQGDTLVTPLHMAMIAGAINNDGVLMKPYILDHTENDGGFKIKSWSSSEYGSLISKEEAQTLQTLMEGVVANGTGSKLSGQSYSAAGKTGSAEYGAEKGKSHGWFIGYGSKESYADIAIAVIVEDGGSGSASAVPVAKQVFDIYFNQ